MKGKLSEKESELKLLCEGGILVDEEELKKHKSNKKTGIGNGQNGTGGYSFVQRASKEVGNAFFQSQGPKPQLEEKKKITICVGGDCTQKSLEKISKVICNAEKGLCRIYITSEEGGERLETPHHICYNKQFIQELSAIVGPRNITVN